MIESKENLDSEISAIKEFFEESNFPYKVDLIHLKDFSNNYLENYLKDRIEV